MIYVTSPVYVAASNVHPVTMTTPSAIEPTTFQAITTATLATTTTDLSSSASPRSSLTDKVLTSTVLEDQQSTSPASKQQNNESVNSNTLSDLSTVIAVEISKKAILYCFIAFIVDKRPLSNSSE